MSRPHCRRWTIGHRVRNNDIVVRQTVVGLAEPGMLCLHSPVRIVRRHTALSATGHAESAVRIADCLRRATLSPQSVSPTVFEVSHPGKIRVKPVASLAETSIFYDFPRSLTRRSGCDGVLSGDAPPRLSCCPSCRRLPRRHWSGWRRPPPRRFPSAWYRPCRSSAFAPRYRWASARGASV